jgi:hypothetical protein
MSVLRDVGLKAENIPSELTERRVCLSPEQEEMLGGDLVRM